MLMGEDSAKYSRRPEIIADAAYYILIQDPKSCTGNFFIDEDVLRTNGVSNFKQYACFPENSDQLILDYFVDDNIDAIESPNTFLTQNVNEKWGQVDDKIAELFKTIETNLTLDTVTETQAVYQFYVTGCESGKWYIDLKTGKGCCGKGEAPTSPDAVLTIDSEQFFNMFNGKLKPATAYLMGKLKITGNLQKALKLEKLMTSLKSKL
ncbi:hydroxysteroid dehydrogenase-like protein 2 [Anoplophora glabripennis]|uniref:hydroxysteroid dehydrogenase-like protein 2 n=1 Tax=Anoplophora glabripennis TaxID=217634 RepID=UPI000873F815|nr:hydroxysteroid dehydrogenase-like protein 2 [Anoplophora glabripennis]